MPIFSYKAKTASGKTINGTMEANERDIVISALRDKNYYPLSVEEAGLLKKEINFDFIQSIKIKDMAVFCRQFSTLINAGITVLSCLDILRLQTENKKLREIIQNIYETVQKGKTLSAAMKEHKIFPSILLNMVEAGEVSGTLDITLERVAVHFEKENKINQKVKGALTYPLIVCVIAVIVIGILITFVVPTFVGLFSGMGMELPVTTKMLLSISNFVKSFWYLLILFGIGVFIFYKYYTSLDSGRKVIDTIKLKIPVFGMVTQKIIASRFTRTLSTLLGSGLSLLVSLEIVGRVVDNYVVEKGLEHAKNEVSRGVNLAEPISQMDVFPPMVVHMVKIGEDTGSLETILEKTADFYDGEVETAIGQMTTLIEPLIICVLAVVVGFVVLSIVQPMFGLYEGIGA